MAKEIRQRIFDEVGLRASAGISINKFTAKIASDMNKPNGQKTIMPEEVLPFLEELAIEKFFGVGKVTAEKMNSLGIFKGKDLKAQSLEFLARNFGKSGRHFYDIVRGIQFSEVKPNRIRKSIAAERTFRRDLSNIDEMLQKLDDIAEELERRMQKSGVKGKTITVKIKYNDFSVHSRSRTQEEWLHKKDEIISLTQELMRQSVIEKPVRLLGLSMTKLDNEQEAEELWTQLKIDFPNWKF